MAAVGQAALIVRTDKATAALVALRDYGRDCLELLVQRPWDAGQLLALARRHAHLVRHLAGQALAEAEVQTLLPQALRVRVGNLEIMDGSVFLDGKPFPVRSLVLRVRADSVVTADVEFMPQAKLAVEALPIVTEDQAKAIARNLVDNFIRAYPEEWRAWEARMEAAEAAEADTPAAAPVVAEPKRGREFL